MAKYIYIYGDLLIVFNGTTITYDEGGDPLHHYNGNVFIWGRGRRLSTITKNGRFFDAFVRKSIVDIGIQLTSQYVENKSIDVSLLIVQEL